MADELAELRARVARLERQCDQLLGLADRIDVNASDLQDLADRVIIPAIFHLAGDGLRDEIREMLVHFRLEWRKTHEAEPLDGRMGLRLDYWLQQLDERPRWHGFDPIGWAPPDA